MILPPLVLVNGQKWVYSFAKELNKTQKQCNNDTFSWTKFQFLLHSRKRKNWNSVLHFFPQSRQKYFLLMCQISIFGLSLVVARFHCMKVDNLKTKLNTIINQSILIWRYIPGGLTVWEVGNSVSVVTSVLQISLFNDALLYTMFPA